MIVGHNFGRVGATLSSFSARTPPAVEGVLAVGLSGMKVLVG
jgi:hypothetical protein